MPGAFAAGLFSTPARLAGVASVWSMPLTPLISGASELGTLGTLELSRRTRLPRRYWPRRTPKARSTVAAGALASIVRRSALAPATVKPCDCSHAVTALTADGFGEKRRSHCAGDR